MNSRLALLFALPLAGLLALLVAALGSDAPDAALPETGRVQPWAVLVSADGKTLYAACEAARQVLVIDVETKRSTAISVDGGPRGLALSPDGTVLAASLGAEDEVALIDLATKRVLRTLRSGRGPEGVAFGADGARLFVAHRLAGDVGVLDVETGEWIARIPAGEEPFALAATPAQDAIVVVSRRAEIAPPEEVPECIVTTIDARTCQVRHKTALPSVHMAESIAITPDGTKALVPAICVRNLLPIVQVARGWVLSGVLAIVDLETGAASVLPLNEEERGFADPTSIAVSPDGKTAWVASGGGNEIAMLDLPGLLDAAPLGLGDRPENFALTSRYSQARISVGRNPCGLAALGADTVLVSERLDGSLALVHREGGRTELFARAEAVPAPQLLEGERAFHDASYCFQEAFSCRSCHPEAHTDGLTYDFEIDGVGRHVVLNRSLRGLRGTAPYKWTGINPSLQRQCGARFAMVLTRAAVMPPKTLDAMAAWLESLPPPRPLVDSDGEMADLVARGKAIFERSRRKNGKRLRPSERCITCHPPPHYTNRQRTDVGSYVPGDPVRAFDVSHLTGVGQKAPYLHDGRATTLEAIFTSAGLGDRHGCVTDLDEGDVRALVAFLQSL